MKTTSLLIVTAVVLGACDNVESYEVATADMRLFMDVRVDGDRAGHVLVQLTTDNEALLEETFVNLAGGDRLVAEYGGNEKGMTEEYIAPLGIYQYVTDFDDMAGGDPVYVSLERPREQDAPRSSVVVPDDFDIDDPGPDFSRASGFSLTWTDTAIAETTHVTMTGECIDDVSADFAGNPGGIDIAPAQIAVKLGNVSNVECPVAIEVVLGNEGDEHPAYGRGGNVHAYQTRTLDITTTQ